MKERSYTVVIERGETSWGAYVPDLDGCVAIGNSKEEVEEQIQKSLQLYIDHLVEKGWPVPEPHSETKVLRISSAV